MRKSKKISRPKPEFLVSACLVGIGCRWDGKKHKNTKLYKLYKQGKIIAVCPEIIGGLGSPRVPSEILGGSGEDVLSGEARVFSKDGLDNTGQFIKGAKKILEIARSFRIKKAILKSKSPSCGHGKIYDGTFTGHVVAGNGVTAAMLMKNNIKVVDEKRY